MRAADDLIHKWDTVPEVRGLVHVVHGMSEHARRYDRLARELNRAGYVVWAHDQRGHGRNPTPPVGLGHFADEDGWRALLDDAWQVSAQLREAYRGRPLFLFAHSMGSFEGQAIIAEHGDAYAGVVLSGTCGAPDIREAAARLLARLQLAVLGARAPGVWVQRAVFGTYNRQFAPNRTAFDWLSRDTAEVDAYVADRLTKAPLTARAWVDFLDGKRHLGRADQVARIPRTLPIYVIGGTQDPVGENARGVQRLLDAYRAGGLQHVTQALYPDARHELINEINRDVVIADLIAWLDLRTRPAS